MPRLKSAILGHLATRRRQAVAAEAVAAVPAAVVVVSTDVLLTYLACNDATWAIDPCPV